MRLFSSIGIYSEVYFVNLNFLSLICVLGVFYIYFIVFIEFNKKFLNFNLLVGNGCFYVFVNGFVNWNFFVNEDSDEF